MTVTDVARVISCHRMTLLLVLSPTIAYLHNPVQHPSAVHSSIFLFRTVFGTMAVLPKVTASAQGSDLSTTSAQPIDVEAWTEQAAEALKAVALTSPGGGRGNPLSLAIDLDQGPDRKADVANEGAGAEYRPRREPLRRDSLKRREALLKGKEGSRRRTRWENGSYH